MSLDHQPYLRFSLEESIWFQKGQEVAELYSISLEPNVFIQENDQYVTIKGTLDLNGEYRNIQRTGESEPRDYTQEFYPRHVQSVRPAANDSLEFSHRFPVDITVPYNRIESTDDIDVTIESFDYTMLEKNCLKLQAELLVGGVYLEVKPPAAEEAEREAEAETEPPELEYQQPETDPALEPLYRSEPEPGYVLEPLNRAEAEPEPDTEDDLYQTFSAEARKQPEAEEETDPRLDYQDAVQIPVVPYPDEEEETDVPAAEAPESAPVRLQESKLEKVQNNDVLEPAYRSVETEERPPEAVQPAVNREAKAEEALQAANREARAEETAQPASNREARAEEALQAANREARAEEALQAANREARAEEAQQAANREARAEEALQAANREARAEEAQQAANREAKAEEEVQAANRETVPEEAAQPAVNRQVKLAELADKTPKSRVKPAQSEAKEEAAEKREQRVSLLDFLGRKQEEELVKMKVCIVQQGDTAASVADRYEVSLQTLLYSNSLEPSQDLYEGQVLYIPRTTAYKS